MDYDLDNDGRTLQQEGGVSLNNNTTNQEFLQFEDNNMGNEEFEFEKKREDIWKKMNDNQSYQVVEENKEDDLEMIDLHEIDDNTFYHKTS